MSEDSPKIGDELEEAIGKLIPVFGWELLAVNLPVKCQRSSHRSLKKSSVEENENKQKRSHGIDLLCKYYNPITDRNEVIVIECKHRQFSSFSKSNVDNWIEELINTIECSNDSPSVKPLLKGCTIVGGILVYCDSDNNYDIQKSQKVIRELKIPAKKTHIPIYLATPMMLDRWKNMLQKIREIDTAPFSIVYPSLVGSRWSKSHVLVPSILFSDYVITSRMEKVEIDGINIEREVKSIFSFDEISDNLIPYIKDMIKQLQLESYEKQRGKIIIYQYAQTNDESRHLLSIKNDNSLEQILKDTELNVLNNSSKFSVFD